MRLAPMLLAAFSAPLAAQSAVPQWPVATIPITVVGFATGDPLLQLDGVSSAHRLPNGQLVIANGDPLELRVYTAHGRFVRRIGRSGEGPGEFSRHVAIFSERGDSVLSFTTGTRRWAVFTADGKLARERNDTSRNTPVDLLMYRHAFYLRGTASPAACTRALIDRLPASASASDIRQVFPDPAGRYWVRGPGAPEWIVYTLTGTAIGRVAMAPTTELLEVGSGFVVVKARDADDIERVEVWRVSLPPATQSVSDPCRTVADSSIHSAYGLASAMMRTDLRNMQTAADAFHKQHDSYPASIADFGVSFSKGANADVHLLMSNPRGWGAMMTDKATGMYCMDFVGATELPGWPSGVQSCAQDAAVGPH